MNSAADPTPTAIRQPRFIQVDQADHAAARDELIRGLAATEAHTSPKFLYDALGSRLFEAITELPEYYPTRTEAAIFAEHAQHMAQVIGNVGTLVDLGAGNCAKAMRLMPALQPARYVAVDISVDFLRDSLRTVQRAHPALDVIGVGLDFSQALRLPPSSVDGRPVFFYPGSSIGNFTPEAARTFLAGVREQARDGAAAGAPAIGAVTMGLMERRRWTALAANATTVSPADNGVHAAEAASVAAWRETR